MDERVSTVLDEVERARKEFNDFRKRVEKGEVKLSSPLEGFVFTKFGTSNGTKRAYEERLQHFEELDRRLQESEGENIAIYYEVRSDGDQIISSRRRIRGDFSMERVETTVYMGRLTGKGLSFDTYQELTAPPLSISEHLKSSGTPSAPNGDGVVIFPTGKNHHQVTVVSPSYLRGPEILPSWKKLRGRPKIPLSFLPHFHNVFLGLGYPASSGVKIGKEVEDYLGDLEGKALIPGGSLLGKVQK